MKIIMSFLLVGLMISLCFSGIIVSSKSIVSLNGKKIYVGGTGPGNYSSIQEAIDDAKNGDTVFVFEDSSPYYENININKQINLIGKNNETTYIIGKGNPSTVTIRANDVLLKGFNIKGGSGQISEIYIHNGENIVISENIIKDEFGGINIDYSYSNIEISYNTIETSYYGICFLSTKEHHKNTKIIGNNISSKGWACIALQCNEYAIVSNNILNGKGSNSVGILISEGFYADSRGNTISHNTIINNKMGINILTYNNLIAKNLIRNNKQGITLRHLGGFNTITKNEITDNVNEGIISYGSTGEVITKNKIERNNIGISLTYDDYFDITSALIKVYQNNFIDNNQNAYDYEENILNVWYHGTNGNYWDDYDGSDILPPQGKGDIPYKIPDGESKDLFPLMEPYTSKSKPKQLSPFSFLERIIDQFPFLSQLFTL